MSVPVLDRRLNAYRADLAAVALKGQVEAARFVEGEPRQVVKPVAPLRASPRFDARLDTEALYGETVRMFDEQEGWSWVQIDRDGYMGYVPSEALGLVSDGTHKVTTLHTHGYPAPDKKVPPSMLFTLNAELTVTGTAHGETGFIQIASGAFVFEKHIAPIEYTEPDFVAVAERFVGTPYLWGGRTSLGIDCSGLIQLSLQSAGRHALRDSDMQESTLGTALPDPGDHTALKRGDLVFWKGHLGVMVDGENLLHANGYYMQTVIEPLSAAVERIAGIHGPVTVIKRLD